MINTALHSNSPHVMYKKYKRLVYTPPQQDFVQQTSETCRTQKNRPDLCSRKLGGTVILYNELKLFVSLNCFKVDYLLLNFSQSRLAVSL